MLAYIDPQFRIIITAPIKSNHGTTPARRAELMRTPFITKGVRRHIIKASVKIDVGAFDVDEEIAIAATHGAIAAVDLVVVR